MMINLLPDETKRNYRAARLNVILRRYVIVLIWALLFMGASFGVGYFVTTQDREVAQQELDRFRQEASKYEKVKKDSADFAKNLATTKSILSSEIIFSELIVDISKTLPKGAILSNLTIGAENLGDDITLSARTVDANETPLRLKQSLEESPLFEKVSIMNITTPAPGAESGATATATAENPMLRSHPVTVNLSATMSKPPKTGVKP